MATKKNITPVEALAEARALVVKRQAEHTEAEAAEGSLVARLKRGDDSVTAADLAEAGTAVRRASLLLDAARQAIAPAERAANKYEAANAPTLAEWLRGLIEADPFGCGVYGFPIAVVASVPSDETGPAVYLTQTRATEYDTAAGVAAGEVGIRVLVPGGIGDGEQMRATLSRAIDGTNSGQRQAQASLTAYGDDKGFNVNARLNLVKLPMPVLTEETADHYVSSLAQGLAGDIARAGHLKQRGYTVGGSNPDQMVSDLKVSTTGPRLHVARDGDVMTRTVDIALTVHGPYEFERLQQRTRSVVNSQHGKFAAGLGRVKSATVLRTYPAEGAGIRKGLQADVQLTIVSKLA